MRLSAATINQLPAEVVRPSYDRAAVRTGVVHLGIGAFHRAHQAAIFDAALAAGDLRWGIVGVSLRSASVRDQLAAQDGLYAIVTRDGDAVEHRIIGAVQEVLVAPADPARVVAVMAAPDTHIVTLTVTEKGYCLDPASGLLRQGDDDIAADLADLSAPRTAPGFIVAALAARRSAGLPPFTTISCDNLPHNGARLRGAVLALARAHDPSLAVWIEQEAAFPQTMVDRIVPATTAADIAALSDEIDIEDRGMVKTEPFLQWVIEDRFCGPRPDFAALGVQLTADVGPWEEAKLRLLNGAHSAIAYLGGLAGIDFVHQFVARQEGRHFVERLWDEAGTTLSPPPGLDIGSYRAALMARFANSSLQHRTRQIAVDGSQKLPQRLVAPILARRRAGQAIDMLALAVAAWMRWQAGIDDAGVGFEVDDPLGVQTGAIVHGNGSAVGQVHAFLAMDAVFPPELGADPLVMVALVANLDRLTRQGALAAIGALPSYAGH